MKENLVNIVTLLLEHFRQFKKLNFKPNPRMVETFLEMGFEEKNIIEALKITGNNQFNAVSIILYRMYCIHIIINSKISDLYSVNGYLVNDNLVYKI